MTTATVDRVKVRVCMWPECRIDAYVIGRSGKHVMHTIYITGNIELDTAKQIAVLLAHQLDAEITRVRGYTGQLMRNDESEGE